MRTGEPATMLPEVEKQQNLCQIVAAAQERGAYVPVFVSKESFVVQTGDLRPPLLRFVVP